MTPPPPIRLLVDAMNVIGARADGWWRDRPGAMRRLAADLRDHAVASREAVTVVFDVPPGELADSAPVRVVVAPRRGRDAADDEIVRLVAADVDRASLRVVTSDAALAARVRSLGAAVEGAGAFRRRLERRP